MLLFYLVQGDHTHQQLVVAKKSFNDPMNYVERPRNHEDAVPERIVENNDTR